MLLIAPAAISGGPDCGAVIEFDLSANCSSSGWRWQIGSSYDGTGPTIHWLQFGGVGGWIAPDQSWAVSALSHRNGPGDNLLAIGGNSSSFWNADQTPAHPDAPPWTATVSMPASAEIVPTKLRYKLYDAATAPRSFMLQCSQDIQWATVLTVSGDAGAARPASARSSPHPHRQRRRVPGRRDTCQLRSSTTSRRITWTWGSPYPTASALGSPT